MPKKHIKIILKNVRMILNKHGVLSKKLLIGLQAKKLEFPDHFLIDNKLISDTSVIANKFNCFFTNVGPKLAAEITNMNNANFMVYLQNPILHNFTFKPIS